MAKEVEFALLILRYVEGIETIRRHDAGSILLRVFTKKIIRNFCAS